jgi:hypothetical protein
MATELRPLTAMESFHAKSQYFLALQEQTNKARAEMEEAFPLFQIKAGSATIGISHATFAPVVCLDFSRSLTLEEAADLGAWLLQMTSPPCKG